MSDSQAFRWEHVSDETRFRQDLERALPPEAQKLLTEGASPPHKGILQGPGFFYYFAREPAETKLDKQYPKSRLRVWTEADGLIAMKERWPMGGQVDIDLPRRRAIVVKAVDDARTKTGLFDVDLDSREVRQLELADGVDATAMMCPVLLADGNVAVKVGKLVRVLLREGDRLKLAPFEVDTGDRVHVGAAGRLLLFPTAIFEVDGAGIRKVAEFPEVMADFQHAFDGRVLRYTKHGCDQLIGPI